MKLFNVIVQKGEYKEDMDIEADNEDQAKSTVIDKFYYDGWHAVSAEEL